MLKIPSRKTFTKRINYTPRACVKSQRAADPIATRMPLSKRHKPKVGHAFVTGSRCADEQWNFQKDTYICGNADSYCADEQWEFSKGHVRMRTRV